VRSSQVWLLEHAAGERRAYHDDPKCFGLAGAKSTLEATSLDAVLGESDHPPCVLCAPPHWRALEKWERQLGSFVEEWNAEAAALRAYQRSKDELEAEQVALRKNTSTALDSIVKEAGGFLSGGRLKYTPSGARGFLCIVATTNERALPAFTLPALTASGQVRLGRQVALAGARLMPSATESTIPDLLQDAQSGAQGASGGLAGVTKKIAGLEGAGSGAAPHFVLGLWGTCLSLYTKGGKS
jgi:hypothetical protein